MERIKQAFGVRNLRERVGVVERERERELGGGGGVITREGFGNGRGGKSQGNIHIHVVGKAISLVDDLYLPHTPTRTHKHPRKQGTSFKNQPLNAAWREKYTRQLISSLSASRLAKSICAQFRARVTASHETFLSAIKQLETRHSGRLKSSEEQRATIRKVLTPKMAKLSLSSVALRDGIVHGLPVTGVCTCSVCVCVCVCCEKHFKH